MKLSRIDSWPDRKGCHVPYLVLLQVVIEMTIDARAVEVVRSHGETSRKKEILSRGGEPLA